MVTKTIGSVLLLLIMLASCSENDSSDLLESPEPEVTEEPDNSLPVDSTYSDCDAFIAQHMGIGTACCISGFLVARPGDTATYHYQINHHDANVSFWVILEGDISILAVNDSQTVTVVMGPNFTGGTIQALASGAYDQQTRLTCNDHIYIKAIPR
jgi:hypothetical protein